MSRWRHSNQFGTVGVFSGAFWRRSVTMGTWLPSRRAASCIAGSARPRAIPRASAMAWFESGQQDEAADRDGNGVIDAVQDTEELIAELERKGYRRAGMSCI